MNFVILQGYIKEPIQLIEQDKITVKFKIGVPRKYKVGEERRIDYFNIEAQKGLAKWVYKTFKQGDFIAVEGKLENEENGVTVKATEIYFSNCNSEISKNVINGNKYIIKE